jgi:4-hydroxyacetophenone monooxygenase
LTRPITSPEELRRVLEHANPNVLRMAVFQVTRNAELANMKVAKRPLRGGAFLESVLSDQDQERVRELAIDMLTGDRTASNAEVPDDETLKDMMSLMTGEPVTEEAFAFGREELAFADVPRAASWTGPSAPPLPAGFSVGIVGAGASGIAAGVQFERLGIPYAIYEKQVDLGGTWNLNQYPDARVDTPSFLYQYKFDKNYPWPEYFASQAEVQQYLVYIAKKYRVYDKIRFRTEVTAGTFDATTGSWSLQIDSETGSYVDHRTVVISASGLFATPKLPNIPGVDHFGGTVFHTTAWPGFEPVDGKRIAIVGNGSTGVQLMPALAGRAAHVSVFQRTPQWISPMEQYREQVSEEFRWILDNVPFYWNWNCYSSEIAALALESAQVYDPQWQAQGGHISPRNDALRRTLTSYIRSEVGNDADLADKLIPDYAPLARRPVVDNGWYAALLRENVELITDPIDRIERSGVITAAGRAIELDTIIFATGFDTTKYAAPTRYVGREGKSLEDYWSVDGARAYLGLTIPTFPNFLVFYGPNAQPRAGALIPWVEIWAKHAADLVVHLVELGAKTFEVSQDTFRSFNKRLDAAAHDIIWVEGAPKDRNYYINEHGRQFVNTTLSYGDSYSYFDGDIFESYIWEA